MPIHHFMTVTITGVLISP